MFNPHEIKKDFPIFQHNPNLIYLDSAATSLKPISVIKKIEDYYKKYSANIHRGIYEIAEKATEEYEETRKIVSLFIHANRQEEIVFTRGTTESMNLIASTYGIDTLEEGDEIVTTIMEHHSNFVPWQQLAASTGVDFKVIDINDHYELSVITQADRRSETDTVEINLAGVITNKTKILALTYVSNTLGTINPIKQIIKAARKINPHVITIVDAAQAAPHMKIDVQDLGCDFLAFSSHKMLGPTGVGVLWGRYDLLEKMSPYQYGGEMISKVAIDHTEFKGSPYKFEAGTPHIAGVIALKTAIQYLEYVGLDDIRAHEKELTMYALRRLSEQFGEEFTVHCPRHSAYMGGIVTFSLGTIHPHDLAQILDEHKISIRAGHHCAQPLHKRLNVSATARVSFYMYNNEVDVDKLITGLQKAKKIFNK